MTRDLLTRTRGRTGCTIVSVFSVQSLEVIGKRVSPRYRVPIPLKHCPSLDLGYEHWTVVTPSHSMVEISYIKKKEISKCYISSLFVENVFVCSSGNLCFGFRSSCVRVSDG